MDKKIEELKPKEIRIKLYEFIKKIIGRPLEWKEQEEIKEIMKEHTEVLSGIYRKQITGADNRNRDLRKKLKKI